jgi:2,3-bisphosphoglycerate-independent phosphoglycerate mutase
MILDGWGYRAERENNAIAMADTPCWDRLWRRDPHALIDTSGEAVGLPEGQMGNSEVGHMNMGAGRIVYQDFTRISKSIREGGFEHNGVLCSSIDRTISAGHTIHIMGLLSPGGVHSHEDHFLAMVQLAANRGATKISVHLFLDGRDTPPRSAKDSIQAMQARVTSIEGATIDSVSGRYFAMDRDKRWDRVQRAYDLIVAATAQHRASTAIAALDAAYGRGESDEFVQPTVVGTPHGVRDGDSIFFVNFRADRARELTQALTDVNFTGFQRNPPRLTAFVCMTEYLKELPALVAFPPAPLPLLMGEILESNGLHQLRIAETEKYAHVTFFFNGGREEPYALEDRILVPSPRIATYDLQPEMSAPELSQKLSEAIRSKQYDVIICNVANPDMVGHTGNLEAAITAVEAVDRCIETVVAAIDCVGGELLITADHGNVEQMLDESTGQKHTAHTTNPVPLLFHGRTARMEESGSLRDIAPTMLYLLGMQKPDVMTGRALVHLC